MFSRMIREEIFEDLKRIAYSGSFPRLHPETLDVGSKAYVDFFEKEVIGDIVHNGGGTCRFYMGPSGSGKSHLLNLLRRRAMQKGMAVVYLEPGQDVGLESWQDLDRHIFNNMEMMIDGRVVNSLYAIINEWSRKHDPDPEALKALKGGHNGFRNAFLMAVQNAQRSQPSRDKLQSYLHGDRILASEAEVLGLKGLKPPLSARNAEQAIRTVLACMRAVGIPGVMLIFDGPDRETADLATLQGKRLNMATQLMRRLVDGSLSELMPACVSLFAVSPAFMQRCFNHYPALEQRIFMPNDFRAPGWRNPLCLMDELNQYRMINDFNHQAAAHYIEILQNCGVKVEVSLSELEQQGLNIIQDICDIGGRRPLMQKYATTLLQLMAGNTANHGG